MLKIKKSNQTIKNAYERFQKSSLYNLWHCYKNHSYLKERAFEYCKELMYKYNGYGLKIISFNQTQFTAGFIGVIDNEEVFVYITKSYDKYIDLKCLK